jgi:hypothetical protein
MSQQADENDTNQNDRTHYRLLYPEQERPELKIERNIFTVIELSEQGAQIEVGRQHGFVLNQPLAGELHFKNGECDSINGFVLRTEDTTVVIGLVDGISIKRILDEQIRLRQQYPQLYRSNDPAT